MYQAHSILRNERSIFQLSLRAVGSTFKGTFCLWATTLRSSSTSPNEHLSDTEDKAQLTKLKAHLCWCTTAPQRTTGKREQLMGCALSDWQDSKQDEIRVAFRTSLVTPPGRTLPELDLISF